MDEGVIKVVYRGRLLIGFFAFLLVLTASCATWQRVFHIVTTQEEDEVRSLCRQLKLPSSFNTIDERVMLKPELASVGFAFSSDEDPALIGDFFVKSLGGDGWQLERKKGLNYETLLFRKNGFAINIDLNTGDYLSGPLKRHSLDCSIGIH